MLVINEYSWNKGRVSFNCKLKVDIFKFFTLRFCCDSKLTAMLTFVVCDSVEANMLYLETPAGVGFSYSSDSSYYGGVDDKMTGTNFSSLYRI